MFASPRRSASPTLRGIATTPALPVHVLPPASAQREIAPAQQAYTYHIDHQLRGHLDEGKEIVRQIRRQLEENAGTQSRVDELTRQNEALQSQIEELTRQNKELQWRLDDVTRAWTKLSQGVGTRADDLALWQQACEAERRKSEEIQRLNDNLQRDVERLNALVVGMKPVEVVREVIKPIEVVREVIREVEKPASPVIGQEDAIFRGDMVLKEKVQAIENRGNLKVDSSTGDVHLLKPIMFVKRTTNDEPVAEFEEPAVAEPTCRDLGELSAIFPDPIRIEGHTRGGTSKFWQTLADDRARIVAEIMVEAGASLNMITTQGLPGTKGLNQTRTVVYFEIPAIGNAEELAAMAALEKARRGRRETVPVRQNPYRRTLSPSPPRPQQMHRPASAGPTPSPVRTSPYGLRSLPRTQPRPLPGTHQRRPASSGPNLSPGRTSPSALRSLPLSARRSPELKPTPRRGDASYRSQSAPR